MKDQNSRLFAFLAVNIVVSAALIFPNLPCAWNPEATFMWLLGLTLVESASPPIPHFGRFSVATVWTIGCLGRLEVAPVTVTIALSTWYCLRIMGSLMKQERDWAFRLAEWAAALAFLPAYLATSKILEPKLIGSLDPDQGLCCWLVAGVANFAVHAKLTQLLVIQLNGAHFSEWARLENILRPMRGLAMCAAFGFLNVSDRFYPLRALLQPVLYGFYLGSQLLIRAIQAQDAQNEILKSEERLRTALAEKDQARREANASAEERRVLEQLGQLSQRLTALQELAQLGPVLGNLLGPSLRLSSLALFFTSDGSWEQLEMVCGESPQLTSLQNFRLLGVGEAQLRQTLRDRVACLANPPLLASEPHGLLLPLGDGLLYLGRPGPPWSEADYRWLGWLSERWRPFMDGLFQRLGERRQLQQVHGQARHLAARLEGQRYLLECAYRFSVHLDVQALWQDTLQWLSGVLELQAAAAWGPESLVWGREFEPNALRDLAERVGQSGSCCYLAAGERSLKPGEFGNVVALPLSVGGMLVLAFGGNQLLQRGELDLLSGVANLFGTALARSSLHQNVVATHRRLEQSQEMWLQSQKSLALAQMSAGVAHEINTPLVAIRLSVESVLPQLPENQGRRLQAALDACSHAQKIIQRLGEMAQRSQHEATPLDMVQLARQVLEQLSPQLRKSDIQLHLECPAQLVCLLSREAAENMLTPLILNAIEALENVAPDRRQLAVRLGTDLEKTWWEVIDRGPGILPELYSRLAEPFFTTKRIGKNVGFGLSIVEQTCRQNGAQLTFGPGPALTGALFRVVLPA